MTKELSDYFQQNMTISCFQGANKWVALSPMEMSIKQKIENNGKSIVDWNLSIYRGVLTGCNEAFVISGSKRNEILDACSSLDERKKTAEIIRPILRGRDVKRYSYDFADQWLIMVECGLTNKHAGNRAPIQWFSETYPTIYKHLNDVELAYQAKPKKKSKGVVNRDDQGDYWWELRPCNYWEDFSKQKIIWKIIGSNISFAYDDNNMVCNNAINIMTGDESKLVQFLGLMNSSLYNWYLKATTEAEVEGDGIQLYATTLSNTKIRLDFGDKLYDKVIQRVKNEITDEELDAYVYNLFKLNKSEIEFIQSRL